MIDQQLMGTVNVELAKKTVDYLNEIFETDPEFIGVMFSFRVRTNNNLAAHPSVQVIAHDGEYSCRLIGLFNGLCGVYGDDHQTGPIGMIVEDGELQGFALVDPSSLVRTEKR